MASGLPESHFLRHRLHSMMASGRVRHVSLHLRPRNGVENSSMSRLKDAVLRSDHSRMMEAIRSGCDLNEMDKQSMTPLLWAILRGDTEAVKILLESGADPNLTRHPSGSPLWHAEDDFGFTEIAELLKSYGARKRESK